MRLNNDELWRQYRDEKRTAAQLAQQYGCSIKTILRRLNQAKKQNHFAIHKSVNVVMDTTYFGRDFGVMLLLNSTSKQVLQAITQRVFEPETQSAFAVYI